MNLNIVWVSIAILFDEGDRYIPEELLMYKINYIVDKVKYLISEYKTGDPFELCDAMGIHIYYTQDPLQFNRFTTGRRQNSTKNRQL